jgi:UDP-2,4-diacetamido-2,4,6-trideoxy-beta-L-altropyranose hydrolase|tara:strand:- start:2901 stop:3971 length:1071 start_codon:yes stop_codon:yes gene_type:complete
MNIVFRVDANDYMGVGHLTRCLRLAKSLAPHAKNILFISRNLPIKFQDLIYKNNFDFESMSGKKNDYLNKNKSSTWLGVNFQKDAEDCINILNKKEEKWDLLVIDHYGIDVKWEMLFKKIVSKIMVIDDLANRNHSCDILLDQNFEDQKRYKGLTSNNSELLLGPKYALLSEDYIDSRKDTRYRKNPIKKLLVFFGGTDVYNLTNMTVQAIIDTNIKFSNIDIVLSKDSPNYNELNKKCEFIDEMNIFSDIPSLCPLINNADLCIGAGGSSTWERMCLGLPSVVITVAENQVPVSKKLNDEGLIFLIGNHKNVSSELIKNQILRISSKIDIYTISKKCMNICNGDGVEKVKNKIVR